MKIYDLNILHELCITWKYGSKVSSQPPNFLCIGINYLYLNHYLQSLVNHKFQNIKLHFKKKNP